VHAGDRAEDGAEPQRGLDRQGVGAAHGDRAGAVHGPAQRLFSSLVAAVLALASWVTSNLGGFVFGLLLGLVGSALAFAWSPAEAGGSAAEPPAAG
jgi:hypothetical protein